MMKRTLIALTALLALAACQSNPSLEQLRATVPAGDTYQVALANNYRAYAEELAAANDWDMSGYFAEKALNAAKGGAIEPEDPVQWKFEAPALGELNDAREALLKALTTNRTTQPELAASTMVAYDRLLVLRHAGWNDEAIAGQKVVLAALMTKLEEAHVASEAAPPPPPTVAAEINRTVLYFPYDSDRLGESAQGALQQLARSIPTDKASAIAINGHADRAGTEDYNMHLSERRARFVLKALEAAGVPSKYMQYFAFGESDPAVPTADGVAEPKNRRVEITIE